MTEYSSATVHLNDPDGNGLQLVASDGGGQVIRVPLSFTRHAILLADMSTKFAARCALKARGVDDA